eukprot:COSAG01_NODE_9_length_43729_cov_66.133463_4_plen_83_part_00
MLLILIRWYQKNISPLLGQRCCHYPSCSEYACIALAHLSWPKALYLTVKRLLSCHPFNGIQIETAALPADIQRELKLSSRSI